MPADLQQIAFAGHVVPMQSTVLAQAPQRLIARGGDDLTHGAGMCGQGVDPRERRFVVDARCEPGCYFAAVVTYRQRDVTQHHRKCGDGAPICKRPHDFASDNSALLIQLPLRNLSRVVADVQSAPSTVRRHRRDPLEILASMICVLTDVSFSPSRFSATTTRERRSVRRAAVARPWCPGRRRASVPAQAHARLPAPIRQESARRTRSCGVPAH